MGAYSSKITSKAAHLKTTFTLSVLAIIIDDDQHLYVNLANNFIINFVMQTLSHKAKGPVVHHCSLSSFKKPYHHYCMHWVKIR